MRKISLFLLLIINYSLPKENIKTLKEFADFQDNFYKTWNITQQKNEEFSIKITKNGINTERYIFSLPKARIDTANTEQMNYLMSFISNEELKKIIKNYLLSDNTGSLIYAIEISGKETRKKIYFEYETIDSYEWINSNKNYKHRTYTLIFDKYISYLEKMLNKKKMGIFDRLKPFLDFQITLLKKNELNNSLCFAFNQNTKLPDVQNIILGLVKEFKIDKKKLKKIFKSIEKFILSWIHISQDEIALYYRKAEWT